LQSWYNQGITKRGRNTVKDIMKTAISLPDSVFAEAEALSQQLGLSRSELYTRALQAYLKKYNRHQILHKLNQVYLQDSSELDPMLAKMQFMSLPREDW
jgi:metal-responsive CopG/Arc/MetJ family transcriptional regulator